ncbi:unnamed protein product [Mycena citricolor]|uniref:DUF6534 domain-containing protein n=1 Tax=Mycena citricolor TaxID=2018698 RepID=A0AAD2HMQ9_9AGAR|nr:unnamed protein product [Mycena citricolor]
MIQSSGSDFAWLMPPFGGANFDFGNCQVEFKPKMTDVHLATCSSKMQERTGRMQNRTNTALGGYYINTSDKNKAGKRSISPPPRLSFIFAPHPPSFKNAARLKRAYPGLCRGLRACVLGLCGVTALQGYLYFTRYQDKIGVRLVAGMMIGLDFLSMALISQSVYYYMLPYFGSFTPLNAVTKELSIECLISAMITFTSQMYFVYQLHMVKNPGTPGVLMKYLVIVMGTVGLAGGIGCVVLMFTHPHEIFMNRKPSFAILAGISKAFGASADIVATIAMCMFLKSAETGMSGTSSLLKSLTHLFINRGILVTAAQILLLITFFATSGHLYWLAVHVNTTKLYVNTFFGMLNARAVIRERATGPGQMSLSSESGNLTMCRKRGSVPMTTAMSSCPEKHLTANFDVEVDSGIGDYAMNEIMVTRSSTVAEI